MNASEIFCSHDSVHFSHHNESQNEINGDDLLVDSKNKLKMLVDSNNNMLQECHEKLQPEKTETSHVGINGHLSHSKQLKRCINTTLRHYNCKKCSKCFSKSSNLRRHERIHNGQQQFKCSFCNKTFYRSDYLKTHIEKIHNGKKFRCNLCDKSYRYKISLTRHKDYHNRHYHCEGCKKKFSKSSDFMKHKQNCVATIKCCFAEQEGTSEQNMSTISSQGENHSGRKLHTCKVCPKKFSRSCNLKQHMLSGHSQDVLVLVSEKLTCESETAPVDGQLTYDSESVEFEKMAEKSCSERVMKIRCKICQTMFISDNNFKQHWLTFHSEGKVSFEDRKMQDTCEVVEIKVMRILQNEVDQSEVSENECTEDIYTNREKKVKCKTCQKILCGRLYKFKRHWLSKHSKGKVPSDDSEWSEMYELVEVKVRRNLQSEANQSKVSEETHPNRVKRIRCKTCQQILSDRLLKFKRHWIARHSKGKVPSDDNEWRKMYEVVEVEVIESQVSKNITGKIFPQKKIKCKSCHKILGRSCKFRQHWLSYHSQKSDPKLKWKEMYEVVDIENSPDGIDKTKGLKKIKCKTCQKVVCGRLSRFKQHWLARHSKKNVPSDDSKWRTMYEFVKVAIQHSPDGVDKNEGLKKIKCKTCQKVVCGRLHNFKRHWLARHCKKNVPSDDSKWRTMYEFVKVEIQHSPDGVDKNEGVKKIKCKTCQKVLCGRLLKFKRHWLARHSKGNVPPDDSKWGEMYEFVKVEIQNPPDTGNDSNAPQCSTVGDSIASENVIGKVKRKRTKKEGRQAKVQRICEDEVNESIEIQDSAEKIFPRKRHQCKVCNKMLCSRSTLKRHWSVKHPEHDINEFERKARETEKVNLKKVKKLRCKLCQKMLSRGFNFRRHWLTFHSKRNVSSQDVQWKKLYDKVEVEVYTSEDGASENEPRKARKVKCKTCQKISRYSNFKLHWLTFHSQEDDLSQDTQWKEMSEIVEMDVECDSQDAVDTNEGNTQILKKIKCKLCQKTLGGRSSNFKRHCLSFHSEEINRSGDSIWKEMFELVEMDANGKTTEEVISKKVISKKVKCKTCQKIVGGPFSNFKQHWLRYHSQEGDGFEDTQWKEMYECIEVEANDGLAGRGIGREKVTYKCKECHKELKKQSNFKRHWLAKHFRKNENKWKVMYECVAVETDDSQEDLTRRPKNGNSRKRKRFQCDTCLRRFNRRFNLNRHRLSAHPELETDSPSEVSCVEIKCECVEEEGNSLNDENEERVCAREDAGCLEDGEPDSSCEFDYVSPGVINVEVKCECVEEENSLYYGNEENGCPPEDSGCLENGTFQFSDEFEETCLSEASNVKVKCERVELQENVLNCEFEAIDEMNYICPQCGEEFNSATDLIQHDVDDH